MGAPADSHARRERSPSEPRGSRSSSCSVTLTATGVTLLGVLVSIGVTVGMGISGPWWLRAAAGLASTVGLVAVVKVTTRTGRGPLARLANWTIDAPTDR